MLKLKLWLFLKKSPYILLVEIPLNKIKESINNKQYFLDLVINFYTTVLYAFSFLKSSQKNIDKTLLSTYHAILIGTLTDKFLKVV